jgi:hypothetical protein
VARPRQVPPASLRVARLQRVVAPLRLAAVLPRPPSRFHGTAG